MESSISLRRTIEKSAIIAANMIINILIYLKAGLFIYALNSVFFDFFFQTFHKVASDTPSNKRKDRTKTRPYTVVLEIDDAVNDCKNYKCNNHRNSPQLTPVPINSHNSKILTFYTRYFISPFLGIEMIIAFLMILTASYSTIQPCMHQAWQSYYNQIERTEHS